MTRRCRVCGEPSTLATCASCAEVAALVARVADPLCVVVDGSYNESYAGAGLVLVLGPPNGDFAAFCACRLDVSSSVEAEYQAIIRARRWAPHVPVYSDCHAAIDLVLGVNRHNSRPLRHRMQQVALGVHYLDPEHRDPNHAFAHRLSRQGRIAVRAELRAKAVG